jgi:hypothetical protein
VGCCVPAANHPLLTQAPALPIGAQTSIASDVLPHCPSNNRAYNRCQLLTVQIVGIPGRRVHVAPFFSRRQAQVLFCNVVPCRPERCDH